MNFIKLLLSWNVLFVAGMQVSEINMALITEPQQVRKANMNNSFVNVCDHKNILCIIMTYLHGESKEDMRQMIANIPSKKILFKLLDLYSSSIVEEHRYPTNIYTPAHVVFIALSYHEFNQRFLTEVSRHPITRRYHIENYNNHIEPVLALANEKKKKNRKIFFDFFSRSFYLVWPLFLYVNVGQSLADCPKLSSHLVRDWRDSNSLSNYAILFHVIGAGTWLMERIGHYFNSCKLLIDSLFNCFDSCPLLLFVWISYIVWSMLIFPITSVILFALSVYELAECGENGPSRLYTSVRFPILTGFLALVFVPLIYVQIEKYVLLKKEKNYLKKFKKFAI